LFMSSWVESHGSIDKEISYLFRPDGQLRANSETRKRVQVWKKDYCIKPILCNTRKKGSGT
jgi:hypothetical protein